MKNLFILLVLFILCQKGLSQKYKFFYDADWETKVYTNNIYKDDIDRIQVDFERYIENDFKYNEIIKPKTLPIVFNIMTSKPELITNSIIQEQVSILNKAFANEIETPSSDFFRDYAINTELKFCIGEEIDLFVRKKAIYNKFTFNDFTEIFKSERGLVPYYPEKFINIWVVEIEDTTIFNQNFVGAGFAQLPFRNSNYDGIIINSALFGRQNNNELYNQGYTLVNLMGKYLGLKPINGFSPCEGDGVDDTPDINTETLICFLQDSSHYVSDGCFFNDRRMTRNFMDNIPDDCASMFTFGQKIRMHANLGLKGPRHTLVNESNEGCINFKFISKENNSDDNDILLFPNPAMSHINIELVNTYTNDEKYTYYIYNLLGNKIISGEIDGNEVIDINQFTQGIYILFVSTNKGKKIKKVFSVVKG